ncbi:MAG: hypothetical protein CBC09_05250 [Cellvibrionales bacterium TMED49]|nr:hypothetical protein [Porticoccaceae bacterium]OUU38557.1 MAG: hypothetical protein CBC09_05250 [Cellvibrionales bacterium TMED49]
MNLLITGFLYVVYPLLMVFLIIPHKLGYFFHKNLRTYLIVLGIMLLSVSGYAGYLQLWSNDDDILQFQMFCIVGALYSPLHFVITQPFEPQFHELHRWILNKTLGGPPTID